MTSTLQATQTPQPESFTRASRSEQASAAFSSQRLIYGDRLRAFAAMSIFSVVAIALNWLVVRIAKLLKAPEWLIP